MTLRAAVVVLGTLSVSLVWLSAQPADQTLEGLWQLHYSLLWNHENVPEEFIANLGDVDSGYGLRLSARADGRFAITNARTGQTKTYAAR